MRARGAIAVVLVALAGLGAISSGRHTTDPPTRIATAAPPTRGPIVGTVPMTDVDEQYALGVEAYLAWRAAQDAIDLAAYLEATKPPPPTPPPAPRSVFAISEHPTTNSGSCAGDFDCFKPCTFSHESGGNYAIVSPSGTYRGAWQFDQSTWNNAVANAGYPEWVGRPANEAPPEIQDAAARWLYSVAGNRPWGGRC